MSVSAIVKISLDNPQKSQHMTFYVDKTPEQLVDIVFGELLREVNQLIEDHLCPKSRAAHYTKLKKEWIDHYSGGTTAPKIKEGKKLRYLEMDTLVVEEESSYRFLYAIQRDLEKDDDGGFNVTVYDF